MIALIILNAAVISRSQCKALHALITKICLLLYKPCLIWIWEIQGPQNLGSVQKLSLLSRY